MKQTTKYLLFLLCPYYSFAQETQDLKLEDINGIWFNSTDKDRYNETQYEIINNGKSFCFTSDSTNSRFLLCGIEGLSFVSKNDSLWENEKVVGNSKKDFLLWGIPYKFYFSKGKGLEATLELESSNIFSYDRVEQLPEFFLKKLYEQGRQDHRDYLKEFLNKKFKEIKNIKVKIYSSPNIETKKFLLKGDAVEIVEEKEEWIKIRYYGQKTTEGWIKKNDIE